MAMKNKNTKSRMDKVGKGFEIFLLVFLIVYSISLLIQDLLFQTQCSTEISCLQADETFFCRFVELEVQKSGKVTNRICNFDRSGV